jgi:hypothetical protein
MHLAPRYTPGLYESASFRIPVFSSGFRCILLALSALFFVSIIDEVHAPTHTHAYRLREFGNCIRGLLRLPVNYLD